MQPSASRPARSRASPADIREAELKPLRDLGLSDVDILDVVPAAAARCFFSSVLEATAAVTDSAYANLDESLREVLTVAARSSKVAPESAAGPRANPDQG
jgi:hypothetical protein